MSTLTNSRRSVFASTMSRLLGMTPGRRREADRLIARIREQRLSYCGFPKLENIAAAVRSVERRSVPGLHLEAGVALGGSAILIARLKSAARELRLYDVFGLIPPPSERDEQDAHARFEEIASGRSQGLGGDGYYGYEDDLFAKVQQNLRSNGVDLERDRVSLHKGLFEQTLHVEQPVAFAHVDCDWYDSVTVCLERIAPHISSGGLMVFDDYSSYSGCKRAVDEFLAKNANFKVDAIERSITIERTR